MAERIRVTDFDMMDRIECSEFLDLVAEGELKSKDYESKKKEGQKGYEYDSDEELMATLHLSLAELANTNPHQIQQELEARKISWRVYLEDVPEWRKTILARLKVENPASYNYIMNM